MVPVEASIRGGDYRDLYRPSQSRTQKGFEAGVPVPLSFLLEHMQELDEAPDEVRYSQEAWLAAMSAHALSKINSSSPNAVQ